MRFKKEISMTFIMGVLIMGLFGCDSETSNFSPEQVVNNALEESTQLESYYAESEMITSEKGEEVDSGIMKEWRTSDGKVRVEVEDMDGTQASIAVNDGVTFLTYDIEKDQAFIIEDPELLAFNQPSPKDQADALLELVRETHEISVTGEEEIAGRSTHHITAKAKEDKGIFGDQELWIDKENWMVLKMISSSGNSVSEISYTKLEFEDTIPEDMFTLDLPDHVEVKNMEDENQASEIELADVPKDLDQPVLYFPETDGLEISAIEKFEMTGEIERVEISVDYKLEDLPLLTLSVFPTPDDLDEDILLPGEESMQVREQKGSYMDLDGMRTLLWQEDGLSYSIIVIDPNLTLEDLKKMTEEMKIIE